MNPSNSNPSSSRKSKQSPCAACAHARRQCPSDCLLRPYFPNDAQHVTIFNNVLKLFTKDKVLTLLNELKPDQRDNAMNSIIFEANVWAEFPGQGCLHMLAMIVAGIQAGERELEHIRQLIALHKFRNISSVPHGYNVQSISCAACAYEQQICNLGCPFRPYFPIDNEENRAAYIKVQKVFEYGNVLGMVNGFGPEKRDQAMRSLIFEADVWDKNPGRGCLPFVKELNEKISAEYAELHGLQQLLASVSGQANQEPLGESSMNLHGAV